MVKNPPAMQKTQVPSLGWEDPLEKGMAAHSIILAWRIPRRESSCGLQVYGVAKGQTQLSNICSVTFTYFMFKHNLLKSSNNPTPILADEQWRHVLQSLETGEWQSPNLTSGRQGMPMASKPPGSESSGECMPTFAEESNNHGFQPST